MRLAIHIGQQQNVVVVSSRRVRLLEIGALTNRDIDICIFRPRCCEETVLHHFWLFRLRSLGPRIRMGRDRDLMVQSANHELNFKGRWLDS